MASGKAGAVHASRLAQARLYRRQASSRGGSEGANQAPSCVDRLKARSAVSSIASSCRITRAPDRIDVGTPMGPRGWALIALMVYSFARVGAAFAMKVNDV